MGGSGAILFFLITGGIGGGGGGGNGTFNRVTGGIGGGGGATFWFVCENAADDNKTQTINKFVLKYFIVIFFIMIQNFTYSIKTKNPVGNRVYPVGLGKLFQDGFPERLLFNS